MDKRKVLFVCSANSARSQMAEALLREYAGDAFEVFSAGYDPKPVNPYAIEVMREIGIDISGQRSKSTMEFIGKEKIDYAVFVCDTAENNCPSLFPFVLERLRWPFPDPASVGEPDDTVKAKFREVRDQISTRIKDWLRSEVNIKIHESRVVSLIPQEQFTKF